MFASASVIQVFDEQHVVAIRWKFITEGAFAGAIIFCRSQLSAILIENLKIEVSGRSLLSRDAKEAGGLVFFCREDKPIYVSGGFQSPVIVLPKFDPVCLFRTIIGFLFKKLLSRDDFDRTVTAGTIGAL